MNKINLNGVAFMAMLTLSGYCLGGRIGLGIAALLMALIHLIR